MDEEDKGNRPSTRTISDVAPVLTALASVQGVQRISISIAKSDSEESFQADVDNAENLEVGDLENPDEESPAEDVEEDPGEVEDEPEEIPPKIDEPVPTKQTTEKKTRIQVDPNASVKDTTENSHCLSALPIVPEGEFPYKPILYTFRVKAKGKTTKLKKMTTKPPPLYLQFDHTIAVIWTLFNKETRKDNLGIVQLQWARHFLESIYTSEGVHSADVQLCIETIENYLIDKYAEMSVESVIYGSSKLSEFANEGKEEKDTPFSVNYAQMIKKCPLGVAEKESVIIDKELQEELENVKKVVGIESIDLTKVVSKEEVMNILSDWKKEQIGKIEEELKMLYVVEDMMKNSDAQNFEGYTDESQFETIFKRNK